MLSIRLSIKSLILKDLIGGWPYLIVITVMIPFLISISLFAMMDDFGGVALGFVTIITFLICKGSALISILVDSVYSADSTYLSLPINRKTLVLSKYFTALLLLSFSYTLIVLTIWFIYNLSGKLDSAFYVLLSLRGILVTLIILIISLLILLPFLISLGEGKGLKYYILTLGIMVLADPIIKFIINIISGIFSFDLLIFKVIFESILIGIKNLSAIELYSFLFLILAASFILSVLVSTKYFSKRDI